MGVQSDGESERERKSIRGKGDKVVGAAAGVSVTTQRAACTR